MKNCRREPGGDGKRSLVTTDRMKTLQNVWSALSIEHMDQPGMVANPARSQLNREKCFFPAPVRAREFRLARQVWPFCPTSACSFSTLRRNLVLTNGIPHDFRNGIRPHILPSTAIGSALGLSGHGIVYRWRSLPKVHRQRTSSP